MIANGYKLTLYAKNLYKEIEIPQDVQRLKIGTESDCDVRLRKSQFFESFAILLVRKEAGFALMCSQGLYITLGDARKLMTAQLTHGTELCVKYQASDMSLFDLTFGIDFDSEKKQYERVVNLSGVQRISIGHEPSSNIVLQSPFTQNDQVLIERNEKETTLRVFSTNYGVYHNGLRIQEAKALKNGDFFSLGDVSFCYKNNRLWMEIRKDIHIQGLPVMDLPTVKTYPKFIRNTRVKTVLDDESIEVLDPPNKPQKQKNNLLMRLLPSLGMVMASVVMAFFGGFMIIFSLVSAAMAIITGVVGVVSSKKEFRQQAQERIEKYTRYIESKRSEIELFRKEELENLEEIYFSADKELLMFSEFSEDLFNRNADDDDFLQVRLGIGQVKAKREISYKKQERLEIEDDLQLMPERLCGEFEFIDSAPIVCDLKNCNALGVYGAENNRFAMLKSIVFDLCARQYYSDIKMFFVAEPLHKERIWWLRFLPYIQNNTLGFRNLVCNEEGKNHVFEYLYKELSTRAQNKYYEERLLVFLYDEYDFKNHPLSRFVKQASSLGVCFIFFAGQKGEVSPGCDFLIALEGENSAALIDTQNKNQSRSFQYTPLDDEMAQKIVNYLAPVYTEEISLEGSLTKKISLFELLGIFAADDLDLNHRWASSKVYESMAAPLGVSKSGVVSLDLHDKAHGPHGLVAGTTGSGKSEILQSYILSSATLFHPYELAFVIIDFKGGGMANQFRDLPHLLGAITNIDGKAIQRSLKSIKAELAKRQRLFAVADVNHIDLYIRKFKSGALKTPLPHLVLIVDEFAELKAEQPEFMKELISAARIGRSLGVHLILATQKPSGQVNEQIWSNSRFKLCLKVQSKEDSNEVLKSPLAAEINEPGRAYLQVGNNEIFELFQSAYSGEAEKADESKQREFTVYSIGESGKRVPIYHQAKAKASAESATQLKAVVRTVAEHFQRSKQRRLPDICLPALPSVLNFSAASARKESSGLWTAIGIYDDPDNQRQNAYRLNLAEGNLLLIGSAQSGKTNVLQAIIRSLTTQYSPNEVNIYIVDFASMVLKTFEALSHVGGVVTSSEDEKLVNLFKLLSDELRERKEKLMAVGLSSFSAYQEAGKADMPHIVLLIDNITMLQELYFKDDDSLLVLCREGLSVGISIVVANAQMSGISYRYKSNFLYKMALYCNDANEYSTVFDFCRERIESIPGRCLVEIDKEHYECQSYLAFEGEREIDRVKQMKAFIQKANALYEKQRARTIPVIPSVLTESFMLEHYTQAQKEPLCVMLGLNYSTVSPFVLELGAMGVLAMSGKEGAGKHNLIRYMLSALQQDASAPIRVYAIDGVKKRLSFLRQEECLASYSLVPEEVFEQLYEIETMLENRYQSMMQGDEDALQGEAFLLLILDNPDALAAICENAKAYAAYKNITGRLKALRVGVLIPCYENASVTYNAPEIVRTLRDNRHFLYFDNMQDLKIFDVPIAMQRQYKKPSEAGDVYYFKGNECHKIKTPLAGK